MLTIRLARIGKKKKPFYRVVVIERTRARDGRVREAVGTYDPLKKPAEVKLDADRIKYWLGSYALKLRSRWSIDSRVLWRVREGSLAVARSRERSRGGPYERTS